MSAEIEIPQPFTVAPLTIGVGLALDFQDQPLEIDLGLDAVNVDLDADLYADMDVDLYAELDAEMDVELDVDLDADLDVDLDADLDADLSLDIKPIEVDMGLDDVNMCLSLNLNVPKFKMHFPMKQQFGIGLFGVQILTFSICGESMIITEDNPPCVEIPCSDYSEAEQEPQPQPSEQPNQPFYTVTLDDEEEP